MRKSCHIEEYFSLCGQIISSFSPTDYINQNNFLQMFLFYCDKNRQSCLNSPKYLEYILHYLHWD
jgi:hypothetical protein